MSLAKRGGVQDPELILLSLYLRFLGGSNPWYCCGMEWVRDSAAVVQDGPEIMCASPQLIAGQNLFATTGPISMCASELPDPPVAPTIVPGSITPYAMRLTWPIAHGNAFEVDWYRLVLRNVATNQTTTVECPGGQFPERIDNGPMTSAACNLLARHPLTDAVISPLIFTISGLSPYFEYRVSVQAASSEKGYGPLGPYSVVARTLEAGWCSLTFCRGTITIHHQPQPHPPL